MSQFNREDDNQPPPIKRVQVFFTNGTSLEIDEPKGISIDGQNRILMAKDSGNDEIGVVLDAVRYWVIVPKTGVR